MNITKVTITKLDGKVKAYASVTLDNDFIVSGIKVLEGANGLFISMPSYKDKNGEFKNICFPCTKESRQKLIDAILTEYNGTGNDPQEDPDFPF